jgi:hypothetical protein
MQERRTNLAWLTVVLAACLALLSGALTSAARAAEVKPPEKSKLNVCKEVKSDKPSYYNWIEFGFVFRKIAHKDDDKDDPQKDKDKFGLKHGKCEKKDLDEGIYRIKEKEVHKDCHLFEINLAKGSAEKVNVKNGVVVVDLKKHKDVKVVFVNKCVDKKKG